MSRVLVAVALGAVALFYLPASANDIDKAMDRAVGLGKKQAFKGLGSLAKSKLGLDGAATPAPATAAPAAAKPAAAVPATAPAAPAAASAEAGKTGSVVDKAKGAATKYGLKYGSKYADKAQHEVDKTLDKVLK